MFQKHLKKTIQKALIVISLLLISSCANLEEEIGFKVISQSAGFTGYYIADGGSIVNFSDSQNVGGSASHEVSAGQIRNLEVNATSKTGAISLTIKIYRNDVKVKEISEIDIATPTTISLAYKINEEDQTN